MVIIYIYRKTSEGLTLIFLMMVITSLMVKHFDVMEKTSEDILI